jgi:AraC-like DNA-binding protein
MAIVLLATAGLNSSLSLHRMLSDPRLADRSIGSIAFDVGFGDLSYFNRTFRGRYGATPGEIRKSALKEADHPRRW